LRIESKESNQLVVRGTSTPLEEGLRPERSLFGYLTGTEDYAEGTKAFLEKRKAVFEGK
jgi:enoyl-CoA hydratase